ncbi:MAG: hypothetical protein ACUVUC_01705 [Thermoguttaceae bacterium]
MKQIVALSVALALGVSSACRRSVTVTGPEGTKATVSQSGQKVEITIPGEGGKKLQFSAGAAAALPDGFPEDAPIYPGAKLTTSMTLPEGMQVSLQTADAAEKVSAFYKERLKAGGWELKATMDTGQAIMLLAEKEGRNLQTMIGREGQTTTLTLTVTEEK